MNTGWLCPVCHRVFAPQITECSTCGKAPAPVAGPWTPTVPGPIHQPNVPLTLPPQSPNMAHQNSQRAYAAWVAQGAPMPGDDAHPL